jgi:DNA-binding NarL/FixJ family response regulator
LSFFQLNCIDYVGYEVSIIFIAKETHIVNIVLADDHKIVRQGIKMLLLDEADFQVVGEAADGIDAVREVERLRPDVLLVDLSMPGLNGIEVTNKVTRIAPKTNIVILSMHSDEAYVRQALEAGAKGYVVKENGVEHLIRAIREVIAGNCYLSATIRSELREYCRGHNGQHHDLTK